METVDADQQHMIDIGGLRGCAKGCPDQQSERNFSS
jgi:hypothetical protein